MQKKIQIHLWLIACVVFFYATKIAPNPTMMYQQQGNPYQASYSSYPATSYPGAQMNYSSAPYQGAAMGRDLMSDEIAMLNATSAAAGNAGYPSTSMQSYGGMSSPTGYPGTTGYSTMPNTTGYGAPITGYGSTGYSAGGYTGGSSMAMGAGVSGGMMTQPMMQTTLPSGALYGAIPVSTTEAESAFDDAAAISIRSTKDDIISTCLRLEKTFKGCNFAATAESTEMGTSTSTLINKAVLAVQKVMNYVSPGYKNVARKITKKISGDISVEPQGNEEQEKWIAIAYMLAAAEHNPSFKQGLTSHTVTASAKIFWQIHQQVFYVQPVCVRAQMPDGTFIENKAEKAFIDKLFQVEQMLTEARSVDVELIQERAFVRGTRMFSSLIIDPAFYATSVGLKTFAFLIFKDGILKWLDSLGGSERTHDELWIVAAEAFNLMHNAIVGAQLIRPASLNSFGVNRSNSFSTDHLLCTPTKGSLTFELQKTTLNLYTKELAAISNYFTKRTTDVASQAGFLAKNDSDLLLICLCAEACEYLMEESTAADCANLIGYFFEKGYLVNSRPVNWNSASNSIANFPCIVLDRLFQKTATSFLSSVKIIGSKSGASSTFGGDYTADSVLQALYLNITIAIESAGKSAIFSSKATKSLRILGERKASLAKNSKLKGFRLRPRIFAGSPAQMTMQPAIQMSRPMTGVQGYPQASPYAQQRPMMGMPATRTMYPQSTYPQQQFIRR